MRARWLLALFLTAVGCFQDDASTQTPCRPACREGFTCVFGTCVSLCNPPCTPGLRCMPIDADRGMCVPDGTDAGAVTRDAAADTGAADAGEADASAPPDDAAADVSDPADAPGATDAPALQDVSTTIDGPAVDATASDVAADRPAMDARADAGVTDAGADVAADRPAADAVYRDVQLPDAGPCGRASEACCAEVGCFPGALCARGRCESYPLEPTECLSTLDCPSGAVCAGLYSCGTNPNWRWCNRCQASRELGSARFGERCATTRDCATGVCSFGRCSFACDLTALGDAQCAGFGVRGGTCAQVTYGLTPIADGGVPRAVQLQGVCELGCARNRDCASGTACIPLSDDLLDRVVFICSTTRATAPAGTPCRYGDDCQSGMCIGGANPMGGAACSAPCTEDSDCPTAAPVCSPIRLYTSRGTSVPTRGCLPRR